MKKSSRKRRFDKQCRSTSNDFRSSALPSNKTFGFTRTLGRKHPFLPKGWGGYVLLSSINKKHCQISISHESASLSSPVGGGVSSASWANSHRTQWPARPALLIPACLVWRAPRQRQVSEVCTERWGERARVLSLSFRLFRAVGSSFGPVWFSPPSQERRFVLILQNPLGGATNFFEIIPGNRYAKVGKTKVCKFFEIFIDITVMNMTFGQE